MPLVVSGLLNKQIAAEIGASEATVKVHRSQLMRKMGAESVADLVRMAAEMGIPAAKPKGSVTPMIAVRKSEVRNPFVK